MLLVDDVVLYCWLGRCRPSVHIKTVCLGADRNRMEQRRTSKSSAGLAGRSLAVLFLIAHRKFSTSCRIEFYKKLDDKMIFGGVEWKGKTSTSFACWLLLSGQVRKQVDFQRKSKYWFWWWTGTFFFIHFIYPIEFKYWNECRLSVLSFHNFLRTRSLHFSIWGNKSWGGIWCSVIRCTFLQ